MQKTFTTKDIEDRIMNLSSQVKNCVNKDESDKINIKITALSELLHVQSPKQKSTIDWSGVMSMAQEVVDSIANGSYHEDNDNDVYLSEEVFKAIYGKDYFTWQNKMLE